MSILDSDRRDFLRAIIGGAAGVSIGCSAFAQAEPDPIKVTKITGTVFLISGDGGNVGLVVSDGGLLMIDGGYAARAGELQKVIASVASQPVRTLFNTHWHPDHVGSNEFLGRTGVKIIAHKNTRYWLSRQVRIEAFHSTFEPLKAEGLPVEVFTDGGKMNWGQEKVEYKWIPNSHTCTDAYVFLRSANVLHTGDLFFNGVYPAIDSTTGGWIGGMAAALDKLLKVGDEQTKIIPGHGPLATKADMKAARDAMHTIYGRLVLLSKKKASIDEVLKANPVSDMEARWGGGFLNGEQFLRIAYPSIATHAQQMKNAKAGLGW